MDKIIFITSHNSPNECKTLDMLKALGYNGDYRIVIDDEDKYIPEYSAKYLSKLVVFPKTKYIEKTDVAHNSTTKPKALVVYARNAIEDYCRINHVKMFCVADDDIKNFSYKYLIHETQQTKTEHLANGDINKVLDYYYDFAIKGNIATLGFGTDNFYFGGYQGLVTGQAVERRSVSNFFIRNRDFDIDWIMPMEDFNTAMKYGKNGILFFTAPQVKLTVAPQYTQSNAKTTGDNGMIEFYNNVNGFTRSFYSSIVRPDCMTTKIFNNKYTPSMKKDNAYPKIISSKYQK